MRQIRPFFDMCHSAGHTDKPFCLMKKTIALCLTLFVLLPALTIPVHMSARRNTRRAQLQKAKREAVQTDVPRDTVWLADGQQAGKVTFAGYEKPLKASRETVMVANGDSTRHLQHVVFDITYTAMNGAELHMRRVNAPAAVAPLHRALVNFASWDVNRVFHYHLNRPTRSHRQATPYRVSITPVCAIYAASGQDIR